MNELLCCTVALCSHWLSWRHQTSGEVYCADSGSLCLFLFGIHLDLTVHVLSSKPHMRGSGFIAPTNKLHEGQIVLYGCRWFHSSKWALFTQIPDLSRAETTSACPVASGTVWIFKWEAVCIAEFKKQWYLWAYGKKIGTVSISMLWRSFWRENYGMLQENPAWFSYIAADTKLEGSCWHTRRLCCHSEGHEQSRKNGLTGVWCCSTKADGKPCTWGEITACPGTGWQLTGCKVVLQKRSWWTPSWTSYMLSWVLCLVLGFPGQEKCGLTGVSPEKGHKDWLKVWSISLKRGGWELFSFEKRKLGEPDHKVYKYIMEGNKGDGARLFSVPVERTRSNGHKLKFTGFPLNIRKWFLFVCLLQGWLNTGASCAESLWSLHDWR